MYNHALALTRRYYLMYGKGIDFNKLQSHLAKLRRTCRLDWKQINAQTVQDIVERIARGYKTFFSLQKNGYKRSRPPRFTPRAKYKSITFKQCGWKISDGNKILIDGKSYKYFKSREIEGNLKVMTLKRDHKNQLFLFIVTDHVPNIKPRTNKSAGFDFGLKHFLTDDQGQTYNVERVYEKHYLNLRKKQQAVSRKNKGSNRRTKAISDLRTIHVKVVNSRRDWQYKLANRLTTENDLIAMETLNFKGMSRLWGRKMSDLSPASFMETLNWVAKRDGKHLVRIDKWFPSSKMCSVCGVINQNLQISDRTWICTCGKNHDRDANAAINILTEGASSVGLGDDKTSLPLGIDAVAA